MHIKQLVIKGFRSYHEQTVVSNLSAQSNVVVGRNGAGKSNFFGAIRFALADAYTSLTPAERRALFATGEISSAFVEIVFDNADNRFPNGRQEVVLRRTVTAKKDDWTLDRKAIAKNELLLLLEAAGFSQSNPYYIVPQGRISSLCNARDEDRLMILKDVAGAGMYESRRQESLNILSQTSLKKSKITELLTYLTQRLAELSEDRKLLDEYNALNAENVRLQFSVHERSLNEVTESLKELEDEKNRDLEARNVESRSAARLQAELRETERLIQASRQSAKKNLLQCGQLEQSHAEVVEQRVQIELVLKDADGDIRRFERDLTDATEQRDVVREQIAADEELVLKILPTLADLQMEQKSLQKEIQEYELKKEAVYKRQCNAKRFKSRSERDSWLQAELQKARSQKRDAEHQKEKLDAMIQQKREHLLSLRDKEKRVRLTVSDHGQRLKDMQARLSLLKSEKQGMRDKLHEARGKAFSESTYMEDLRENASVLERQIYTMMDKATALGLKEVVRMNAGVDPEESGIYGPLFELFDCDPELVTAVEATAGGSLFHVVVRDENVATEVLTSLNRNRSGRVTFMPLNRLRPMRPSYPPSTNDVYPLIERLRGDELFKPALQQVFGKTLICSTLEIASKASRSQKLNTITLEGDRVDRKGALTGGYLDHSRSRLSSVRELKSLKTLLRSRQTTSDELKMDIEKVARDYEVLSTTVMQAENDLDRQMQEFEGLRTEIELLNEEETRTDEAICLRERTIETLQEDIHALAVSIQETERELHSPFAPDRRSEEQDAQDLATLNQNLSQLKKNCEATAVKVGKFGNQKANAEQRLRNNLIPRRDELEIEIQRLAVRVNQKERKAQSRNRLEELCAQEGKLVRELEQLQEKLQKTQAEEDALKSKFEELQSTFQRSRRRVTDGKENSEQYFARRNVLLQKKEEFLRAISELGSLPSDPYKYRTAPHPTLVRLLENVNNELKKYVHVNKKAHDQHSSFSKQKGTFQKRKEELDKNQKSIEDLIETLDMRKNESMERTFKQVALYFEQVFTRLVPSGRARLVMQRSLPGMRRHVPGDAQGRERSRNGRPGKRRRVPSADSDENLGEDSDEKSEGEPFLDVTNDSNGQKDGQAHSPYVGVSIQVSFTSKKLGEGTAMRMQQLSGGQKSVVALSLIFAIQKCDPAPFYLFDEIDSNLDEEYRKAVADLIAESSRGAQFVMTTFRPELLEQAARCYGVEFDGKKSKIRTIEKPQALDFVQPLQGGSHVTGDQGIP